MFSFRKFVGVRKFSSPGVPFWRTRLLAQWTMYMYSGIATGRLRWGCLLVGRGGRGVCSWVDHFPGGFLTTGEYQSWKYSKGTPFPLWMFMVPPAPQVPFPHLFGPFLHFCYATVWCGGNLPLGIHRNCGIHSDTGTSSPAQVHPRSSLIEVFINSIHCPIIHPLCSLNPKVLYMYLNGIME